MKQQMNPIGKPGKQLLMAALLTAGLAFAAQAEAYPGAPPRASMGYYRPPVQTVIITPPPARYGYWAPQPVIYRQPIQRVIVAPPPLRYDYYRPGPPHRYPPLRRSWIFWP